MFKNNYNIYKNIIIMNRNRPLSPVYKTFSRLHPCILEHPEDKIQKTEESEKEKEPDYVFINSSNGYLDKEVTSLKIRVHRLEKELKILKSLLKKEKK